MSDMYTDASELGHFRTNIGLVVGIIISIISISIGIYLSFYDKNPHSKEVNAIVSKVLDQDGKCNSSYDNQNIQRVNCSLLIQYEYEGKTYKPETPLNTTDGFHIVGGPITVYIDPMNPSDFSTFPLKYEKMIGWGVIIFGVIILLISIFTWWLSQRYKFYAASQGLMFGLGGFR